MVFTPFLNSFLSGMLLNIKLGQLFSRKNTYLFFSTILFIGCTAFVIFRGYKCVDKYLKNPEQSQVSYKGSSKNTFPSFTLCAHKNDSYNEDQMKKCQLEQKDYVLGSQWVGKGGINCTNPKFLHDQAVASSENLEIEMIGIYTFKEKTHWIWGENLTLKLATKIPDQRCFTFSIPEYIVGEGIEEVGIWSKPFELLYLHKEGVLSALIPGGSFRAKYADIVYAHVTHESVELLNYDGKNCNVSKDYSYDNCKQNYIHKVCLKYIFDNFSFSFPAVYNENGMEVEIVMNEMGKLNESADFF